MIYRRLGKTGIDVSVIGLGAEHLDLKPYERIDETVGACLEHEINIMDLFMPGREVRENIGKALGAKRKDMIIQGHIGSVDINQQFDKSRDIALCEKYFEDLMRYLKTDYIDVGMLFFIDTDEEYKQVFESEIFPYAQRLKREGKIRAIGAGSHKYEVAKRLVEKELIEVLMFSLNPAFDITPAGEDAFSTIETNDGFTKFETVGIDKKRAELYRLCESKNVAITAMKTYGAGKLLSAEHSPFGRALTTSQCIHYALERPAVASALVGMQFRSEVEEAVKYLSATDGERDYTGIVNSFKGGFGGQCVYCNHCQPCPAEINVAELMKFLDAALLDRNNIPVNIIDGYKALGRGASECTECGNCEARCPFGVEVITNMRTAREVFA